MALNDAVPSSATDVFKRNIEDTDRLLNTTDDVVNRVGTTLESFPNATGRVSDAADAAQVAIQADVDAAEAAKVAALSSYTQWNSRGNWASATAYLAGDVWQNTATSTWYLVLNAYTSGATVNDDIAGPNITVLQGAKYGTFEGLSDAVAFVTAHPELFPDNTAISTSSYRTQSECTTHGIDYPDGGGADYIIVAAGTGTDDGGSFIDAGTVQLMLNSRMPYVDIRQFGLVNNGTNSDSSYINAALLYAGSSGINVARLPAGRSTVTVSGTLSGFDYCILVPDGVTLEGAGYQNTEIFMANGQDAIVVTNDRDATTSNESLVGLTINGNSDNQTTSVVDFGIWFRNSSNVHLDQVRTVDTGSFGYRLQTIYNLSFGALFCHHAPVDPEETADGFHLIDCNDVAGDKLLIYTEGDDGFVIEANARDVENISIGEVVVTTPITSTAAGKGLYIVNNAANGAAGIQRELRNISLPNVVTHNCNGTAMILQRGVFKNINISHTDYASRIGAGFLVGDTAGAGVAGSVENSSFTLKSYNAVENGMETTIADGFIDGNIIDSQVYNPGDANVGVDLKGSNWVGRIQVNYDPQGTKVSPAQACRLSTSDSSFDVTLKGGTSSLRLEGYTLPTRIHPIQIICNRS